MEDLYLYRREEIESYRQLTIDVEPVRTAGTLFLLRYQARKSGRPGSADWPELLKEGIQLVNAGSRDPLILSCTGMVLFWNGRHQESRVLLTDAWSRFDECDYPARCRAELPEYLRAVSLNLHDEEGVREWESKSAEVIRAWLKSEELTRYRARFIWHDVNVCMRLSRSDEQLATCKALLEALSGDESIDAWIRHMIQGTYYQSVAWKLLKSREVDTSKGIGKQKFDENQKLAATNFRTAHELRPDLPEAATQMIYVATEYDADESPRVWFDRAVAAQFDVHPAYEALQRSLRPSWGGSYEAMYRFGSECAATERYDTGVPGVLLNIVSVIDLDDPQREILKQPGVYEQCRKIFNGMIADPSHAVGKTVSVDHDWLKNKHFAMALKAGRFDDALDRLLEIDKRWNQELIRQEQINVAREKVRLPALIGPGGKQVEEAEQTLTLSIPDSKHAADVGSLLAPALRQSKESQGRAYIEHLLRYDRLQKQYETGQWIDLTFDKQFLDWTNCSGEWTNIDDRTVIGKVLNPNSGLMLRLAVPFHGAFVIEFDVESLYTQAYHTAGGLMIGSFNNKYLDQSQMIAYFVDAKRGVAGSSVPLASPTVFRYPSKKSSRMRVKVSNGYYEMYLDGKYIDSRKHERCQTGPIVAIGSPTWFVGDGEMKFSNVRIRKWTLGMPPPFSDENARADYYSKAVQVEPDNARAWQMLGVARFYQEDDQAAIRAINRSLELPQMNLIGSNLFLGNAYMSAGDYVKAVEQFQLGTRGKTEQVRRLSKSYLALVLATAPVEDLRNGRRALSLAEAVCEETEYNDADGLDALAAAHAELGHFDEAQKHIQAAIKLSDEEKRPSFLKHQESYKQKKPYRMPTAEEKAAQPQRQLKPAN